MQVKEITEVDEESFTLRFSNDGKKLAVGGSEGEIRLYDVNGGKVSVGPIKSALHLPIPPPTHPGEPTQVSSILLSFPSSTHNLSTL